MRICRTLDAFPIRFIRLTLAAAVLAICGKPAPADDEPIPVAEIKRETKVDFQQEVLPILRKNCIACHNSTKSESDLVLETPAAIRQGGSEGPAAEAGKGAESLLLILAARQRESYMPPDDNDVGAKQLTSEELGLIKLWIDQGAAGEVTGSATPLKWQQLPPGVNPIYSVAVSQDGQFAAAGRANQVFLYHLPSRRAMGRLTDPAVLESGIYDKPGVAHLDLVQSVAFSPDGQYLATGGYQTAKIWRRQSGQSAGDLPGLPAPARTMIVSPDGRYAAAGLDDGKVVIIDLQQNKPLHTLTGHAGPVTALAFDATSKVLASGAEDKQLRLWDLETGAVQAAITSSQPIGSVALTATHVATGGGDNAIRVWRRPPQPSKIEAALAATSHDGKWIAAAAADGKIQLVNSADQAVAATLGGHAGGATSLAFNTANNRLVSVGADKQIRVWELPSGKELSAMPAEGATIAVINAAGKQMAAGAADGSLRLLAVGEEKEPLAVSEIKQAITGLAFSSGGDALFVSSQDGTLRRFNPADGKQAFSANHGSPVHCLAVSHNGQLLASGGEDKLVKVWNAGNGAAAAKPQLAGASGPVRGVAFSADDKLLVAGANEIAWFDVATGQFQESVATSGPVASLGSLSGPASAIFGVPGQPLQRGDALLERSLAGHSQPVAALAVLKDNQICSGAKDNTARIWNLENGQAIRTLNHGGPVTAVAVQLGGAKLATASSNKSIKLWNAADGKQLAELKGDFRAALDESALTRAVALAQQRIKLAEADLKAGNARKKSEEDNAKKADEALKKADTAFKAKDEAAKKPVAAKAAADKALTEAKTKDEQTQKTLEATQATAKAAAEAATKAQQSATAAAKTAADTAKAAAAAAAKQKQAAEAAAKDTENKDLTAAKGAADKAAAEAEKAKTDAAAAKAAADKALKEANTKKTQADADQKKATAERNAAQNAVKQAEAKVKAAAAPAKKALDEQAAAKRTLETSQRTVERAKQSVAKATAEIPRLEAAVKAEQDLKKARDEQLASSKKTNLDSQQPFHSVAFTLDGKTLIGGDAAGKLYTWDVENLAPLEVFGGLEGVVVGVGASDGRLIGAAGAKLLTWISQPAWELASTIGSPSDKVPLLTDRVTALAFSPDGKTLATGSGEPSRSGEIKLWNVEDAQLIREIKEPHSDTLFALEFSRDGQHLASCGADRFMKVFQVADGALVRAYEGHTHHVLGVSWSADGRTLATGGADNVIKIWDFRSGDQKRTISGFSKELTSIRFVGDSTNVVASCGDKNVHVRRSDNGGNVRSLSGGTDFMFSVATSADGKLLVAGGQDSVLRVWNDAGKVLATFAPPEPDTASDQSGG